MLRTMIVAGLALLAACWSVPAAAQCGSGPGPVAFTLDRATLGQRATEVNLWYVSTEAAVLPFDARIAERNRRIVLIYDAVATKRRAAWTDARCTVTDTKKCASSTGNTNRCPRNIAPPPNMRFVPDTIVPVGSGIKAGPALTNIGTVAYTIGKSGRGSNTGGFRATAVFAQPYIDAQVAGEVRQVEQYVTPILNGGVGTGVTTTVTVPGGGGGEPSPGGAGGPGASVAEQLATLARLHAEGKLTDAEFEAAKRRVLGL